MTHFVKRVKPIYALYQPQRPTEEQEELFAQSNQVQIVLLDIYGLGGGQIHINLH